MVSGGGIGNMTGEGLPSADAEQPKGLDSKPGPSPELRRLLEELGGQVKGSGVEPVRGQQEVEAGKEDGGPVAGSEKAGVVQAPDVPRRSLSGWFRNRFSKGVKAPEASNLSKDELAEDRDRLERMSSAKIQEVIEDQAMQGRLQRETMEEEIQKRNLLSYPEEPVEKGESAAKIVVPGGVPAKGAEGSVPTPPVAGEREAERPLTVTVGEKELALDEIEKRLASIPSDMPIPEDSFVGLSAKDRFDARHERYYRDYGDRTTGAVWPEDVFSKFKFAQYRDAVRFYIDEIKHFSEERDSNPEAGGQIDENIKHIKILIDGSPNLLVSEVEPVESAPVGTEQVLQPPVTEVVAEAVTEEAVQTEASTSEVGEKVPEEMQRAVAAEFLGLSSEERLRKAPVLRPIEISDGTVSRVIQYQKDGSLTITNTTNGKTMDFEEFLGALEEDLRQNGSSEEQVENTLGVFNEELGREVQYQQTL